ncbi:MAG: helicase-related protein [Kiloniellales bacterium]
MLGPTNTGKTYLAVDRMLGHSSGMIGFPLRLLARENYDRVCREKGPRSVALITGEEKIVPPNPRWFVCTVESMPLDRPVSFLAVDEIQLCADPERGHVFTDRLLNARGQDETMFLGADTIRPLMARLVPEAMFISRPRFSTLTYTGPKKLTRLAPRSAAVAFSAADVYAIAELIRRHRGGTAVVLGALSPRTRNAQVAMYQVGEVDYMVATDAIGMGLNMDLDHVAFARLRKFDGRAPRPLTPAELAQIAGRAGRHMSDGSFGTTVEVGGLDPETVERVESHRFEALKAVYWRNVGLDYGSPRELIRSLEAPPPRPEMVRVGDADDQAALRLLAREPEIAELARAPAAVRLLWEVCQIPDYRKVLSDAHARLLGRIYRHLMAPAGRLPEDWVATMIGRLDRTDGDIDTLVHRIAHVRTWTYVSHRGDWLGDAAHWQQKTRGLEDRLSDALHQRLTQRFVDRRTAVLVRRLKERDTLLAAVKRSGEVVVEGEHVGTLEGFQFRPDAGAEDSRALIAAARRALNSEIAQRVRRLEMADDDAFGLEPDGHVAWIEHQQRAPVARLGRGAGPLKPRVEPLRGELLDGALAERVRRRLSAWLERYLRRTLAALLRVSEAELTGPARGLAFQLGEGLGVLGRGPGHPEVERQLSALDGDARRALRRLGVRFGRQAVFIPSLLKPDVVRVKAALWAAEAGRPVPPLPPVGRVSLPVDAGLPDDFYTAIGYRPLGPRALRVDMVERFAEAAWRLARQGSFRAPPALGALAGCGKGEIAGVLCALGYRATIDDDGVSFSWPARRGGRKGPAKAKRPRGAKGERDAAVRSPFAKLGRLPRTR